MKWNMVFAMIVAVGSLTATAVGAQENAAASGATAKEGQTANEGQTAKSDSVPYGMYADEPATPDADGVPVAKPNPMSDFLERARQLGPTGVEMPRWWTTSGRTGRRPTDRRSDATAAGRARGLPHGCKEVSHVEIDRDTPRSSARWMRARVHVPTG